MRPTLRCSETRRGEEKLHNVFKGIVVGFIGFVLWFVVSVVYSIGTGLGGGENSTFNAFMFLGFFRMIGGPVVYIVILPIRGWWRRKRSARAEAAIH